MSEPVRAAAFNLLAEPSVCFLPRALEAFSKRGLLPDRLSLLREGALVRLHVEFDAMPADMVHRVDGDLARLVGVVEQVAAGAAPAPLAVAA